MSKKNTIEQTHAEIARGISHAKKKMFKRHREGMLLDDALQLFHAELPTPETLATAIAAPPASPEEIGEQTTEIVKLSRQIKTLRQKMTDAIHRGTPASEAARQFASDVFLDFCQTVPGFQDKPLPPASPAHKDSKNDPDEEPDLLDTLGLDNASIDAIAEQYKAAGDDDYLNLTLALLERISKLCKAAPPRISLEDYIATVIARLFRATYYVELTSVSYAETADEKLRIVKGGEA